MILTAAVLCIGAAILTFVLLEAARDLQYRIFRDTGSVPSTQHWCLVACFIAGAFELAALVLLILFVIQHPRGPATLQPERGSAPAQERVDAAGRPASK